MSDVQIFAAQLQRVGGHAQILADMTEAREALQRLMSERQSQTCVCWDTSLARVLYPDAISVAASMPDDRMRQLCLSADIGITEADYGIADSGTVVLESGPGRSRLVSLLPPIHVALLPESRILQDFPQLVRCYDSGDGLKRLEAMSCLTFVTGPSRTADIEQTLTVGVHGPQEVHVLIVNNPSS